MSELFDIRKIEDYKNVISYFADLSAVPRGSGFNEKASAFLCNFAKEHGLSYYSDDSLNVIIRKPATKGYENCKPVILQGHMDMVCVADPDIKHDFRTEGLELRLDGEWLTANGTTLGGDDGIAVAYMMALLADDNAKHPELICVVTTDEETGMYGAKGLDLSKLSDAGYLVNLDSEEEGVCWCGCAGGMRIDGRMPVVRTEKTGTVLDLTLKGLRGGHSGSEIHRGITNAVILMGRLLYSLKDVCSYSLVKLSGGEKDNAIPSFANAKVLISGDYDMQTITDYLEKITDYYTLREPELVLETEYSDKASYEAIDEASLDKLLFMLLNTPNGVQAMSSSIEGLVETSMNLGIFELTDSEACFHYSLRSSVEAELMFLSKRVHMMLESVGGRGNDNSKYPAWEYKPVSALRDCFSEACEEITGEKPGVTVIHAGLECGLFAEKLPELDMISVGPDMRDIHTPRERLNITSALRLFKVLEVLLSKIS